MMNLMKTKSLLSAILVAGLCGPTLLSAAAPDKADSLFADPVIATGKGFEIKRSQLDDAFISYKATVAANGGAIQDDQRASVRSNLLQHLIITKILTQKATADDKAKTKEMVDQNIDEARKSAPSPAAFESEIKASGMTLAQVRDRAMEEQLCRRILQREASAGVTISENDAKKFYDENQSKFEQPEQVRAAHILISTLDSVTQRPLPSDQKKAKEQLARSIRERAVKGEDFAALVKQYSEDPGSKDKGGEYKFPRHQMVPEFESAAFSLKVGQISDLVETQYGYHIIKVLEKFPAKQTQFAEVEPKIKDYLTEQAAEKALPGYLDKIKTEANVALLDPDTGKPIPAAAK